jgi:hypothetical protein
MRKPSPSSLQAVVSNRPARQTAPQPIHVNDSASETADELFPIDEEFKEF